MQKIIFNQLIASPWKNGRGLTREIAIYPENSTLETFIWRISAATINEAGFFSHFKNIERSLILLNGGKVFVNVNSHSQILSMDEEPLKFSGEDVVEVVKCESSALDFGVMSHRNAVEHTMKKMNLKVQEEYQRECSVTLVLSLSPCVINSVTLDSYDSILLNESDEKLIYNDSTNVDAYLVIVEIN